jgi:tRNA_anti-like
MKKILIIGLASVCALAIAGYNLYNKSHRFVKDEEAIAITAVALFSAFETNEENANKLYLDKVIEVSGVVSEIITNQSGKQVIILSTNNPMLGINCTMENSIEPIQIGSTVSITGICTGYLSDVILTRGIIKKHK